MLGTASRSLMATPICEGESPFLAMVTMRSVMLRGVWATQRAVLRLKGVTAALMPLPLPFDWILPINQYLLNKILAEKEVSLAVGVAVLALALPQRFEGVEDALVLGREVVEGHAALGLLAGAEAGVAFLLFLHAVLQPVGHDLEPLPLDLPEVFLRQRELLHVARAFDELDGARVHAFFPLGGREGGEVVEEELVLAEDHESLEEVVDGDFEVVVVVALHPLLDEVVVAVGGQHDAVAAVGHPSQSLLQEGVGLQDGAFLDLQHPPPRLHRLRLHQLVQRLAHRLRLAVAQHEG